MNQRVEFVLRGLRTDNFRGLCREFGISAKTGYKWWQRFLEKGLEGLEEKSRRPLSSPGGLEERVVCEIIRLKQAHQKWGPRKLRAIYRDDHAQCPSESSFKRVLERVGLTEKRRTRAHHQGGRLHTGRKAQGCNQVWTVDFKGWWYDPQMGRCEPLTVRDEYSRYVLAVEAVADARTETVRASFERLFERYGLPEAIRSDNGSPFASVRSVLGLSRLSAWWVVLGIDLERSRPGCPQDNGAHERLHLDIRREVEGQGPVDQSFLNQWRRTYNEERPHEALDMRCPAQVYQRSEQRYAGTPADLEYRGMDHQKVSSAGQIKVGQHRIFISEAIKGWSVGLELCAANLWNIWFGRFLLGQVDETSACFKPAQAPAARATPAADESQNEQPLIAAGASCLNG